MIGYIKGIVDTLSEGKMILDNHGIGYEILIPSSFLDAGIREGQELKVYTCMSVREDGISLFGFLTRDDLEVYQLLIGVNGIGPKAALSILSTLSADDLRFAVLSDDVKTISRTPGIGKKTAQKLILDLKDKFDLEDAFEQKLTHSDGNNDTSVSKETGVFQEAVQALTALGYSNTEALQAVKKVEITDQMNTETVLKAALKHMF
ncbi:MAG: Holliday junction branch migration protein RuvA [Lachnospiraceae bacterium]|nr:Holliday junction branch migration protein RuvA [Lachnospiraceae bacterium]